MKKKSDKKKLELIKKFEEFDLEMETSLHALQDFANSLNNTEFLPLDYTWESLDKIERLYKAVLKKEVEIEINEDIFSTRIARYLGETLRKNLGGGWELEKDEDLINFGLPGISNIKGLAPDYNWCPLIVINNFRYDFKEGLFREAAVSHLDWIKKK